MSGLFGNAAIFQDTGIFGEEGEATPATTPEPVKIPAGDGSTAVVVNDPTTHTPPLPAAEPVEAETTGDVTLITEPSDDDVEVIDLDADDASADLSEGVDTVQSLIDQMEQRTSAMSVIEQNGIDPLTFGMLSRAGLLSSAAVGGMSAEAFTDTFAGSQDSVMSVEGLGSLVGDAGKALVKGGEGAGKGALDLGSKILSRIGIVGKTTSEAVESAVKATEAAVEKGAEKVASGAAKPRVRVQAAVGRTTKDAIGGAAEGAEAAAGKVLSAKNAMIALAATAAVGVGLKMLLSSVPAPTATVEAKNSYFGKVVQWVRGIKLPWAKLDVTTGEGGEAAGKLTCNGKIVKGAAGAAEQAAASAATSGPLGWTKEMFEQAKGKLTGLSENVGKAFEGLGGKFHALSGAGEAAGKSASEQMTAKGASATVAKAAGVFAHGSYVAGVFTILALISAVIYFVVVGGLRLVRKSASED